MATSATPSTAPALTRAAGENQPRDAASTSSMTIPSRVTPLPTQASNRAPEIGDRNRGGATGWGKEAGDAV
ncbi:hypothetical protein GCM10009608_66480 [Pseudonocardia alaniniphila]